MEQFPRVSQDGLVVDYELALDRLHELSGPDLAELALVLDGRTDAPVFARLRAAVDRALGVADADDTCWAAGVEPVCADPPPHLPANVVALRLRL